MKLKCGHDLSKGDPTCSLQANNRNLVMCFRDHTRGQYRFNSHVIKGIYFVIRVLLKGNIVTALLHGNKINACLKFKFCGIT
jgi:hypothetical protein